MLDVGEHQLLVLLLVMEAELDDVTRLVELGHARIDVRAVLHHFLDGGTGQKAARGAIPARADGVVVRVEEERVARIEGLVAVARGEHEGLEEPGGVREMPLERAAVRHRLRHEILDGEAATDRFGSPSHLTVRGVPIHPWILSRSSEFRLIGSDIRTIRDMSLT